MQLLESNWASTRTVQSHPGISFVYYSLKYAHGVQVTSFRKETSFVDRHKKKKSKNLIAHLQDIPNDIL